MTLATDRLKTENLRLSARIDALTESGTANIDFERDRAQRFLDAAEVMLVALDTRGTILLANRFACNVLGWSDGELVGRDWFEICLPERLRESWKEKYQRLLDGELTVGQNLVLTKSGGERMIEWRNTLQHDETGRVTGTLSSGADITERHALEAQLLHSQKIEAVGQLASGVAHDFNNLLTVILGFSNLVLADSAVDDPRRPDMEEIRHAGLRAAVLTRQLLTFSRKHVVESELIDLSVLVEGMREMLGRLIGEDVRIELTHDVAPQWIQADHGQMEQVVMNLAVNARDAMVKGGTLTIGVTHEEVTVVRCARGGRLGPGHYVKLSVTDSGTGMTPAVLARLFEPFFTTKTIGKGTGLGLATVHGIVGRFGGCIDIDTVPGTGTTFAVYLPQAAAPAHTASVRAPFRRRRTCTEVILVVDDDRGVRDLARRLLERAGYRVLSAANAVEARKVLAANPLVDLLLTDVVMPGDSGPELMRSLCVQRPELKVVYMSAYAEKAIAHHGVLDPGIIFLHKPFSADTLAAKVGLKLDAACSDAGECPQS